nr:hypothetical protein [Clostridiales bacterium]
YDVPDEIRRGCVPPQRGPAAVSTLCLTTLGGNLRERRGKSIRIYGRIPSPDTPVDLSSCLGCSADFLLGISTPETEAEEGFETVLLNVYEFRDVWTRDQKMYLAYASIYGQRFRMLDMSDQNIAPAGQLSRRVAR